jgi:perosamine synthetase
MLQRPAIEGGAPVRTAPLAYSQPTLQEADRRAVLEVLGGEMLTSGPRIPALEARFATYVGAPHALALSSGTGALHAATFAAGLGPGDEVVVADLSFVASANAVLFVGATPVFADVREDTLGIDPAAVERNIGPRTRAVVAVDFAGHPVELDRLMAICRQHGLRLIDDACHAPGAVATDGRRVGSIADLTVFSLHAVKPIVAGEGGMVTTGDPELARRVRLFRNHGITSEAGERMLRGEFAYDMVELGYNYRLSDIHAALALSHLDRAEALLCRREKLVARYQAGLRDLEGVRPVLPLPGSRSAWHLLSVRLPLERLTVDRAAIHRALVAEGIRANVHYRPIHLQPYYRGRLGTGPGLCPVAEASYERLLSLPLFSGMSDRDVDDVLEALGKVLRWYSR